MILKHSKSKWIEVPDFDDLKVKVEYPTIAQNENMRELFFQVIYNNPNYTKEKDAPEIELTIEQKAKEKILLERLAKMKIRYCVKDWEVVEDESGNKIECKIVKNEIESDTFESFMSNFEYKHIIHLGDLIEKETEFNDADKKK